MPQPFRGVESGWWSRVRPRGMSSGGRGEALWPWAAPWHTAALCLPCLDLEPLQLQQPLQVLLEGPYRLRSRGTPAIRMKKYCQLSQAPAVKGRRQKVWVTVAGFINLIFITHCAMRSWEVRGKVITVDDLSPEVKMRRGAGGTGRGQHWQPLRV